jgi:cell division protein ZapA
MDARPVNLRIAGQSYKVVSSASESELHRLAETVNAKVESLTAPGKAANPQAVLLAAMALAHELEEERARRVAVERRAREMLRRVLGSIDEALASAPARAMTIAAAPEDEALATAPASTREMSAAASSEH